MEDFEFTIEDPRLHFQRGVVVDLFDENSLVDGDTVRIFVDRDYYDYTYRKYRLHGLDAPEIYGVEKGTDEWEAGMEATNWLSDKVENEEVILKSYPHPGKFGRWLCKIWLPNEDVSINKQLIQNKLAVPYEE